MTVTVGEIISAVDRARNKINDEYKKPEPPDEELIDILNDYIDMLESIPVKR